MFAIFHLVGYSIFKLKAENLNNEIESIRNR